METEKRELTGRINGRFIKGVSGNPGGRPKKLPEVAVACREMTPSVLATLAEIINDDDAKDADRIAACRLVLEYGIGKPRQHIAVSQERPEFDVTQLSDAELEAELNRQLAIARTIGS